MKTAPKILLTLSLSIFIQFIPEFAFAKGCAESLITRCRQKGSKVMGDLSAGMLTATNLSGNQAAGAEAGALGNCAQGMGGASGACESLASECKTVCSRDQVSMCEEEVRKAAGELAAQGASCGANGAAAQSTQDGMSGGGMGNLGSMLGALAGLAGQMMQKKEEKPKEYGALRPDGSIDCSKADAYQYADCSGHIQGRCNSNMEDQLCANYASLFCSGAGPGPGAPTVLPLPGGPGAPVPPGTGGGVAIQAAMIQPPALQPGSGNGTGFCQMVAQYAYCRSGGRDTCPACMQLQQMKSPTCQQNPALCMAQNSPDVLARSAPLCPGDPVIAANIGQGGGQIAVGYTGGGNTVTQLPGNGTPGLGGNPVTGGGPLPTVVLPQSAEGRAAQLGMKTASASGAVREGQALGRVGTAGGEGRSGSGGARYGVQSSGREVAGVLPRNRTGSIGPAPDVQGQFGPSVFSVGSQAIRSRCAAGRLLNCP